MSCISGYGRNATMAVVVTSGLIAGGITAITTPSSADTATAPSVSVNRALKGDRLPQAGEKHEALPTSSTFIVPPSKSSHVPFGCDSTFSPIADPSSAGIYGRCFA